MSIAYQSWEVGSGPTVGYKVQAHQAAAPGADGFAFRKLNIYRPALPLPQNHLDGSRTPSTFFPSSAPRLGSSDTCSSRADDSSLARLVPEGGGTSSSRSSGSLDVGVASSVSLIVAQAPKSPGRVGTAGGSSLEDGTDMPCTSSSSLITSSISEDSSDESDGKEVQSAFKGPLEQMDSLMTTLPIRRGLSKFYVGKSRSFTSLADVKSMSIKDLAKPENPYARRRKLPIHREGLDSNKPRFPPPRISTGIAKKPITSNATTLTLAVAMSTKGEDVDDCLATSCTTGRRWQKSCRSFSLTDLQKA